MKILYFVVGLIYLPIMMTIRGVEYITDLGDTFIDNIKFVIRMKKNLENEE